MAVSRDEVRHIAGLARIGVPPERLDALATELNGILAHMDALQRVRSAGEARRSEDAHEGMPLREDVPPGVALQRAREDFAPKVSSSDGAPAPAMLDGFFLVPRLATHEDAGGDA